MMVIVMKDTMMMMMEMMMMNELMMMMKVAVTGSLSCACPAKRWSWWTICGSSGRSCWTWPTRCARCC